MDKKDWQNYAATFKELLGLEYSPVAINCIKGLAQSKTKEKVRICRAILDSGKGKVIEIDKSNNACLGAGWHLGFSQIKNPRTAEIFKKFVVEEEKLFSSHEALDKLIAQMSVPPDNSQSHFILAPMEKSEFKPQLVIFIVDAEAACKILTLVTFSDGVMPQIKIGGPTCRMSIIYPLVTGEVNISFYDHTARNICRVEKDKLLICVPYDKISKMVESIDKCSAGRAKMSYPSELGNSI